MTLDHIITASIAAATAILAAGIVAIAVSHYRKSNADYDGMEFEEPQTPKQHPIWRDEP